MSLLRFSEPETGLADLTGRFARCHSTVSELRKAAEITDQEIDVAVDAALADLATEAQPLAKGWTLDHVETLRTNTRAAEALTT